jgi:glyoxylase-like metal-dependent hydrolase (beta-lactamase superfamily II)
VSPPPFQHWTIGSFEVFSLNDGALALPPSRFVDVPHKRAATAADLRQDKVEIQVNCFLLDTRDGLVLIDAGCGAAFAPAAGNLLKSLELLGFSPDDVTHILMTHLHVDHAGGLVDADGARVFNNARVHLAEAELAYWRQFDATDAGADRSVKAAAAALSAYRERLLPCPAHSQPRPGVVSVPLPGHTPGHTGFLVADHGEQIFVWGDIVHLASLQFAQPNYGYAADVDGPLGVETRRKAFADAAAEGAVIAGMHLPFPGVGTVARIRDGFSFLPRASA